MNRQTFIDLVRDRYGAEPEYPWVGDADSAVFRHAGNRKWFALLMNISPRHLHLSGDAPIDVVNLKCDPLLIGSARLLPGIFPAYHMNKDHWITALLENGADDATILQLLDLSHALTAPKPAARRAKSPARAL